MHRWLWTLLLAGSILAQSAPVWAKPPAKIAGIIKGFECGDNCYLTISTTGSGEITGLCVAKACSPWNSVAKIPHRLIGAKVIVTLGIAHQVDSEGNDMGPFKSFTSVLVLKH